MAVWYAPDWIVNPMRATLTLFLEWTGSYGIAIILLTLALRVLMLPLTVYQNRAAKRIQEVQPLIKQIQEKYRDQPEKLNMEMMELYRKYKINPFSGCLPLLIQMPFLYAMFIVLMNYDPVATAQISPAFGWIPSLNEPDPYFVLPALTVVTMFVQMYLSTTSSDPSQRTMVWVMPLLFGWITFRMPAGVVLYWVVSNLIGLIQQAIYPGFPRLAGAPGVKGDAKGR
ncbi:MAG TPA: YidC/Oxa1 family membrane protein insertase [Symbiobacteriaceae bacterium]